MELQFQPAAANTGLNDVFSQHGGRLSIKAVAEKIKHPELFNVAAERKHLCLKKGGGEKKSGVCGFHVNHLSASGVWR